MPKETILPGLSKPPKRHQWDLKRIQGHVQGKFRERGYTYFLYLYTEWNKEIGCVWRFIPTSMEGQTEKIIREMEQEIRDKYHL